MAMPNPAMFADDAIVIYNVLKNKNDPNNKKKNKSGQAVQGEQNIPFNQYPFVMHNKTANERFRARQEREKRANAIRLVAETIKRNPKLTATALLSASGVAASMYAPPEYMGPAEGESKFDARRAAKSALLWNAAGRSIMSVPSEAAQAAQAIKADQYAKALESIAFTGPGIGAAVPLINAAMKREKPELADIRKGMLYGTIPIVPYMVRDGVRASDKVDELLERMFPT